MTNATHLNEIMTELKKPFSEKDLQWRIQRSGITNGSPWAVAIAYIDSRAVQNRLDDVMTPAYWSDSYETIPNGFICTLSLKMEDGWVSKSDGGEMTDIEGLKGGLSDAFKRAAVKWGIGRYLYDMKEEWVEFVEKDQGEKVKIDGQYFYWRIKNKKPMEFKNSGPTNYGKVHTQQHQVNTSTKFPGMESGNLITAAQYEHIMRMKNGQFTESEWAEIKEKIGFDDVSKMTKKMASDVINEMNIQKAKRAQKTGT